jgi:hypothetical protein
MMRCQLGNYNGREDNIKMDLKIGCVGKNWIQLAQDRVQ